LFIRTTQQLQVSGFRASVDAILDCEDRNKRALALGIEEPYRVEIVEECEYIQE